MGGHKQKGMCKIRHYSKKNLTSQICCFYYLSHNTGARGQSEMKYEQIPNKLKEMQFM